MLAHLDKLPPFLCVALARVGYRRKTLREIAADSGLNYRKVERISRRLSWASVKVTDAHAFAAACGVDLICQTEAREYLARQRDQKHIFPHLSSAELAKFTAMMERFKARSTPAP